MTHTLHRQGNEAELRRDFVIMAISAQGINSKGSAAKFKRFSEIILKHNPVSFGDMKVGNMFTTGAEAVMAGHQDNSIVHGVFTDEDTVVTVLKELKRADTGLSIVVSGLVSKTEECCARAGLSPHTVEHSLGVSGRTHDLPCRQVLEIATMCGHGMVGFALIEDYADKVASGEISPEDAARTLAGQCQCGILNPERAARLLKAMAARRKTEASPAATGREEES